MAQRPWTTLMDEAEHLVRLNQGEVPSILRSYIFPDPAGGTIRVVHVDGKALPEQAAVPIQFGPDQRYRIFHPFSIAIVDVDGPDRLSPPDGWGSWGDATVIERQKRRRAG